MSIALLQLLVNTQKLPFESVSFVENVILSATVLEDELYLKDWVSTLFPFILYAEKEYSKKAINTQILILDSFDSKPWKN